jgi:FSR family fosmidomycin resistance protein-like MFS transporter
MTMMLGHFTLDMYSGVIPLLYPLLTDKFELSLSTVGLVSLAYSGMSSISQPLFGMLADRKGTRLIGLSMMWTAFMFSVTGFVDSFPMLLLFAGLAGLGSGAFHPFGAVGAAAASGNLNRNTAMSLYVTGGTLGVASGPLIGAVLFHYFGLQGTGAMIIPGTAICFWMFAEMKTLAVPPRRKLNIGEHLPPIPWNLLWVIIALMMVRSWTLSSLQAFIPVWYRDMGYSAAFYSPLSTVLLLSSAIGAVGSGTLADKHGRRIIMLVSSAATVPILLLFAQFPGWFGFITAILIGLLAASTGPLLLVMAQQLMRGRAGAASGMILGFGFIMGAIGIPVVGAIGDRIGLPGAFRVQAAIACIAIFLSWKLPTEREFTRMSAEGTFK